MGSVVLVNGFVAARIAFEGVSASGERALANVKTDCGRMCRLIAFLHCVAVNRRFLGLLDAIKMILNGADIDIDAFVARNRT